MTNSGPVGGQHLFLYTTNLYIKDTQYNSNEVLLV